MSSQAEHIEKYLHRLLSPIIFSSPYKIAWMTVQTTAIALHASTWCGPRTELSSAAESSFSFIPFWNLVADDPILIK